MTDILSNTRIDGYKSQARVLRQKLAGNGTEISHGQALEMVAQQHGSRDWNTLRAMAERPGNDRPLAVGDRVSGRYLGQVFTGVVHGLSQMGQSGHTRITLHFDEAVDVVTFDSFSSFRQRVSVVIDADGRTIQKTSNGEPHMVVSRVGL
ncbi:MAG: glyoxalase superfamily protein [Sedimentitalea sp.]